MKKLITFLFLFSAVCQSLADDRPNIELILADDLG